MTDDRNAIYWEFVETLILSQYLFNVVCYPQVEPGWLEPLLVRIMDNPKRLVCPIIENIHLEGYHFEPVSAYLRGKK